MRMTRTLLIAALALVPMAPAWGQSAPGGWRLLEAREGIIVFRQFHQQSRLETFRGVMRMKLADEYSMLALYNDVDAFPDWLHLIQGAEEISRNGPLDRDLRFLINLPWPVKDREAVVNARQRQITREGEESVVTTLRARPGLIEPNNDYLRIPKLHGVFKLERIKPETVEVTFQVRLDMGGWIPNWMVNMVLRDMPWHTLDNLRGIVRREQYQNQYYDYLDLFGPGRPDHLPEPKSWVYNTVNQSTGEQTAEADKVDTSPQTANETDTGSGQQAAQTAEAESAQETGEADKTEPREQTADATPAPP